MLNARFPTIFMSLAIALPALAQVPAGDDYPSKPVKVTIPFAVGGAMDTIVRPLGEAFQRSTGQPWVIENVGGAGGTIAASQVLRARPDGYSVLLGTNGPITIGPLIYPTLPYDPREFVPIVHIADSANVLYASAESGIKVLEDVLSRARRSPGSIKFAHAGIGSLGHLSVELLASEAKVSFNGIPYKGSGAALADLASGEVTLLFTNYSTALPMVQAGRVRPIAVASSERLKLLPDVPTFSELGYPNVVASVWAGLMAPKGTPQVVVDKLVREVNEALKEPGFRSRMESQGWELRGGNTADFRLAIAQDGQRWRDLAKLVDISAK